MPFFKFSVTSKKFTIFRFLYMVILNPSKLSAWDTEQLSQAVHRYNRE